MRFDHLCLDGDVYLRCQHRIRAERCGLAADWKFETTYALRDRRLADPQFLCSPRKAAGSCDRRERAQQMEIEDTTVVYGFEPE